MLEKEKFGSVLIFLLCHFSNAVGQRSISTTMDTKTATQMIPALGRPFSLGMLYDIRKDELVPGVTLWNEKTMSGATAEPQNERSTKCNITAEDKITEKANAMDINASLKLSFMGGLIEVGGSAAYLDDRKSSNRKARVTLNYSVTTRFEKLSMELLGKGNAEYQDAFEHDIATHVVTGIMYGGRAIFVFDREVSESENFKKVAGALHVSVKSLPGIQIEGDASVKIDQHEKEKVEKFNCTFYGDFIPDKNPTTYEDAVLLYRDLPKIMLDENGANSRALKVWLYPLENLDSKAAKLVRDISVNLVNQVEDVFEELQKYHMRCNDLLVEDVCVYFPRIKDQVFQFQKMVSEYKTNFQQRLMPVLPKIRGCGAEESDLAQILLEKDEGPFASRELTVWLDEKEREIKVLRSYVKMMKDVQFANNPGDLDSAIGDPTNRIVACYTFKLSGKFDRTLYKLTKFFGKPDYEEGNYMPELPWYECKEVMQRMMKSARLFRGFASVNKDTKKTKVIIADEVLNADGQAMGANIILYKDSVVVDGDFEPPTAPLNPKVKTIEHNSITLDWQKPEFGSYNVQQYECLYRILADSGDDWQSTVSTETSIKLSGLQPATAHQMRVRTVCVAGYSAVVDVPGELGATVTLPTSPPSKPRAKDVGATTLTLVWFKPISIGEKVEIIHYKICWKKIAAKTGSSDEDENWTVIKTKTAVESFTIVALRPETKYKFQVVAICGKAGCSAPSEDSDEVTTTPFKVQDNMLGPSSYPSPKVVVIGVTGSGKSTLCNALTGKDPKGNDEGGFPVSAEPTSCTWQTTMRCANWLGTNQQFTIIDTPGLDDPSGADTQNIAEMIEQLKKIQYVNAFLIVFNGQNPRLDRSLKAMLQIFKGMFGTSFLSNTIIQFSRWSFDRRSQEMRKDQGLSEASQHREWNKKFREDLGAGIDVPSFYVDACYLKNDPLEAEAFKAQTSKLWEAIVKLEPYECKDFEAVMAEHDRLIEEAKESEVKRQEAEAAKKRALEAEERARKAEERAWLAKKKADKEKADAEESSRRAQEAAERARIAKEKADRGKADADAATRRALEQKELERKGRQEAEEKAEYERRKGDWERFFSQYSDNRELADQLFNNYPDKGGSTYVGVYNPVYGFNNHCVMSSLGEHFRWRFHGHNIVYGHTSATSAPSHWKNAFDSAVDTAGGDAQAVCNHIQYHLDLAGVKWLLIHVVGWGNGLRANLSGSALFKNREGHCSCAVVLGQ